jgi:uncharacterized protein YoxC
METVLLAFAVAYAVALLVLYLEVKNLQEKINSTRSEVTKLVEASVAEATKPLMEKLPGFEKRVEEVGHEVRELNFAVKAVQQMQIQSSQGKR